MPWIIDYPLVLDAMRSEGFRCRYFNGGAFDFADGVDVREVVWPADDAAATAGRVVAAWRAAVPGPAWLMPMTHWRHAFATAGGGEDVDGGGGVSGGGWLAAVIESAGFDPGQLSRRETAAAIEFRDDDDGDSAALQRVLARLLDSPGAGDFAIAFPRRALLCETRAKGPAIAWRAAGDEVVEKLSRQRGTD